MIKGNSMNGSIIEDLEIIELKNSKFVKPVRINYIQNKSKKTWEAVRSHDSVAVLLYNETNDSFLLVKQFRPPVYINHKEYGFTYELCAGIIDKDIPLVNIVQEEIIEECGYKVETKNIQRISSFFTNVGISGGRQHLYYAKISEDLKINEGGGIHDEYIELENIPLKDAKKFIYDESKAKTPGLIFAFYWFFENYNKI